MIVEIVLVALLPALLIAAAVWDLTSYTIPNLFILALLGLFAVFAAALAFSGSPMDWHQAALHFLAGGIGLLAGMGLFAAGWIGGGDAKLFAVVTLWLGWNALLEYTLLASLLGGGLTLALLSLRRVALPPFLTRQDWLMRLADKHAGVPYGVALSVAALLILPHTELFRLAAGG
jgi:prepilin peptidase CpaA